MDNFLTISDFTDDTQLSISDRSTGEFDQMLNRIQISFLRKVLGVTLFNSFSLGLLSDEPEQKWKDLRDGCNLVVEGETFWFDGIKAALKYFTYFQYQRNGVHTHTPNGNVQMLNENSVNVAPIGNIVEAQNKCFDLIEDVEFFIDLKSEDYPDFYFCNPLNTRFNCFGI